MRRNSLRESLRCVVSFCVFVLLSAAVIAQESTAPSSTSVPIGVVTSGASRSASNVPILPQEASMIAPLIAAAIAPPSLPITDDIAAERAFGRVCPKISSAPWRVRIEDKYPYPPSGDPLDAILPNTRAYVTNTDSCRCLDDECREGMIQYRVALEGAVPTDGWSGALQASHADGRVFYRPLNPGAAICLPEGRYRLATKRWTGEESRSCEAYEQDATLRALVIVALGDSYSSGEGAPAGRVTASQWPFVADRHRNDLDKLVPQGGRVLAMWQRQSTAELPVRDVGNRVLPGFGWTKQQRMHFEAHRSPFAPASLFAMKVEADSPSSNVTFVNLAESGATIELGALNAGCIPETSCAATFDGSQIDRLQALLAGREVDALILGFGGNDAGFARVASAYVIREPSLRGTPGYDYPSKREIRNAIRSGVWSGIFGEETPVAGMDRLEGEYARLASELDRQLSNELADARVFLLGYPAPHKKRGPVDRTGSYCEFLGNLAPFLEAEAAFVDSVSGHLSKFLALAAPPLLFADATVRFRVDEDEALQSHIDFYLPLTETQNRAARTHRWEYVKMPDTFEDHHICAGRPYDIHRRDSYSPRLPPTDLPNRWFRAGVEGFVITGSASGDISGNTGLLHPNEGGYREMARALMDRWSGHSGSPDQDPSEEPEICRANQRCCEPVPLGGGCMSGFCVPVNAECP